MQTGTRRRRVAGLVVVLTALAFAGLTAEPAAAGPCYTVTYENGSPNPPSATVCPFD